MPAERDTHQGLTFVYSSFYHLYRQQVAKGLVLKSKSLHPNLAETESLKRWARHEGHAKRELNQQMRSLSDARKRLSYLMNELDQILKRG